MSRVSKFQIVVLACSIFFEFHALGQIKNKDIHLSIVPGLGTSGLDPGNISASFSLNIFNGYLHSLHGIEISGISSLETEQTKGIQISGLMSTTGTNTYAGKKDREVLTMKKSGHSNDLVGFQGSGVLNVVRGNATGSQVTLGVNSSRSMIGVQVAGLVNHTERYLLGGQLGLMSNISKGPGSGFQISILYNYTKDDFEGFQLGFINKVHTIDGRNSVLSDKPTALQFGGVNMSHKMNGYQVGLVNISKEMRGTQIGLINIYSTPYKTTQKAGTSVGLLNLGSSASLKYFFDEIFIQNVALGTGNAKNAAILSRRKTTYNMNYLLYRTSNYSRSRYRAYGYSFEHALYKYTIGTMNEFNYVSMSAGTSYVQFKEKNSGNDWLVELSFEAGTKLHPKLGGLYLYAAVDGNLHRGNSGNELAPSYLSFTNRSDTEILSYWPGFRAGIMIR